MNLNLTSLILTVLLISGCKSYESTPVPQYVTRHITFTDTQVVTQVRSFDTIISVQTRDTVIIRDKETQVQVRVVKLPGDSIFIEPLFPSDTVVIEKVRVETVEQTVMDAWNHNKWKKHLLIGAVAVVGLFGIGYAVKAFKA